MSSIEGLTSAKEQIESFSWADFRLVRRFSYEQNEHDAPIVRLVVETAGQLTNWRIAIVGRGVQGLRLSNWGGGSTWIGGLDCISIEDRQWERLRWEALDYDSGSLHLYCFELAIEAIEQIS